jgi:hypothetical protein
MSDRNDHRAADKKLSEALVAMVQSGQFQSAKLVAIRLPCGDSYTTVKAAIFSDSEIMGETAVARLGEPTLHEKMGLSPLPPEVDEGKVTILEQVTMQHERQSATATKG